MIDKKLTIKQEKFVLKYFECGNATEAYKHAYDAQNMKNETITSKAYELLKNGKITAMLDDLRTKAKEATGWNVQRVLSYYTEVIEIGLGKKASKHIITNSIGDGISQTLEAELCDTNLTAVTTALNAIAKHLGMFTQKVEVNGELSLKDFVKEFYEKTQEDR